MICNNCNNGTSYRKYKRNIEQKRIQKQTSFKSSTYTNHLKLHNSESKNDIISKNNEGIKYDSYDRHLRNLKNNNYKNLEKDNATIPIIGNKIKPYTSYLCENIKLSFSFIFDKITLEEDLLKNDYINKLIEIFNIESCISIVFIDATKSFEQEFLNKSIIFYEIYGIYNELQKLKILLLDTNFFIDDEETRIERKSCMIINIEDKLVEYNNNNLLDINSDNFNLKKILIESLSRNKENIILDYEHDLYLTSGYGTLFNISKSSNDSFNIDTSQYNYDLAEHLSEAPYNKNNMAYSKNNIKPFNSYWEITKIKLDPDIHYGINNSNFIFNSTFVNITHAYLLRNTFFSKNSGYLTKDYFNRLIVSNKLEDSKYKRNTSWMYNLFIFTNISNSEIIDIDFIRSNPDTLIRIHLLRLIDYDVVLFANDSTQETITGLKLCQNNIASVENNYYNIFKFEYNSENSNYIILSQYYTIYFGINFVINELPVDYIYYKLSDGIFGIPTDPYKFKITENTYNISSYSIVNDDIIPNKETNMTVVIKIDTTNISIDLKNKIDNNETKIVVLDNDITNSEALLVGKEGSLNTPDGDIVYMLTINFNRDEEYGLLYYYLVDDSKIYSIKSYEEGYFDGFLYLNENETRKIDNIIDSFSDRSHINDSSLDISKYLNELYYDESKMAINDNSYIDRPLYNSEWKIEKLLINNDFYYRLHNTFDNFNSVNKGYLTKDENNNLIIANKIDFDITSIENDSWRNQCFKFRNTNNEYINLTGLEIVQSSLPSKSELKLNLNEDILTFEIDKFMESFKSLFDSDLSFLFTYKIKEITYGSINISLELSGPGNILKTNLKELNIEDNTEYNYNSIDYDEPIIELSISSSGNLKVGNYEIDESNNKIFSNGAIETITREPGKTIVNTINADGSEIILTTTLSSNVDGNNSIETSIVENITKDSKSNVINKIITIITTITDINGNIIQNETDYNKYNPVTDNIQEKKITTVIYSNEDEITIEKKFIPNTNPLELLTKKRFIKNLSNNETLIRNLNIDNDTILSQKKEIVIEDYNKKETIIQELDLNVPPIIISTQRNVRQQNLDGSVSNINTNIDIDGNIINVSSQISYTNDNGQIRNINFINGNKVGVQEQKVSYVNGVEITMLTNLDINGNIIGIQEIVLDGDTTVVIEKSSTGAILNSTTSTRSIDPLNGSIIVIEEIKDSNNVLVSNTRKTNNYDASGLPIETLEITTFDSGEVNVITQTNNVNYDPLTGNEIISQTTTNEEGISSIEVIIPSTVSGISRKNIYDSRNILIEIIETQTILDVLIETFYTPLNEKTGSKETTIIGGVTTIKYKNIIGEITSITVSSQQGNKTIVETQDSEGNTIEIVETTVGINGETTRKTMDSDGNIIETALITVEADGTIRTVSQDSIGTTTSTVVIDGVTTRVIEDTQGNKIITTIDGDITTTTSEIKDSTGIITGTSVTTIVGNVTTIETYDSMGVITGSEVITVNGNTTTTTTKDSTGLSIFTKIVTVNGDFLITSEINEVTGETITVTVDTETGEEVDYELLENKFFFAGTNKLYINPNTRNQYIKANIYEDTIDLSEFNIEYSEVNNGYSIYNNIKTFNYNSIQSNIYWDILVNINGSNISYSIKEKSSSNEDIFKYKFKNSEGYVLEYINSIKRFPINNLIVHSDDKTIIDTLGNIINFSDSINGTKVDYTFNTGAVYYYDNDSYKDVSKNIIYSDGSILYNSGNMKDNLGNCIYLDGNIKYINDIVRDKSGNIIYPDGSIIYKTGQIIDKSNNIIYLNEEDGLIFDNNDNIIDICINKILSKNKGIIYNTGERRDICGNVEYNDSFRYNNSDINLDGTIVCNNTTIKDRFGSIRYPIGTIIYESGHFKDELDNIRYPDNEILYNNGDKIDICNNLIYNNNTVVYNNNDNNNIIRDNIGNIIYIDNGVIQSIRYNYPITLGNDENPKILCLHEGGETAEMFKEQIKDIASELENHYKLYFPLAQENGNKWVIDSPTNIDYIPKSLSYLDEYISYHGPFMGILGYSQGSMFASYYLSTNPSNVFSWAALFNGYLPTNHQGLLDSINNISPIDIKVLVYTETNDINHSLTLLQAEEISNNYISSTGNGYLTKIESLELNDSLIKKENNKFEDVINWIKGVDTYYNINYIGSDVEYYNNIITTVSVILNDIFKVPSPNDNRYDIILESNTNFESGVLGSAIPSQNKIILNSSIKDTYSNLNDVQYNNEVSILIHEILHIFGLYINFESEDRYYIYNIGTNEGRFIWDGIGSVNGYKEVLLRNNYTNVNDIQYVILEDDGGQGTAHVHIEENEYGYLDNILYPVIENEIITGYLNYPNNYITELTLGALKELNFNINENTKYIRSQNNLTIYPQYENREIYVDLINNEFKFYENDNYSIERLSNNLIIYSNYRFIVRDNVISDVSFYIYSIEDNVDNSSITVVNNGTNNIEVVLNGIKINDTLNYYSMNGEISGNFIFGYE